MTSPEPTSADRPEDAVDLVREEDLERVLKDVPKGTLALAGLAVALTLILWLLVYFGLFIPRGPIN